MSLFVLSMRSKQGTMDVLTVWGSLVRFETTSWTIRAKSCGGSRALVVCTEGTRPAMMSPINFHLDRTFCLYFQLWWFLGQDGNEIRGFGRSGALCPARTRSQPLRLTVKCVYVQCARRSVNKNEQALFQGEGTRCLEALAYFYVGGTPRSAGIFGDQPGSSSNAEWNGKRRRMCKFL